MGRMSWKVQANRNRTITPKSENMMSRWYFSITAYTVAISDLLWFCEYISNCLAGLITLQLAPRSYKSPHQSPNYVMTTHHIRLYIGEEQFETKKERRKK